MKPGSHPEAGDEQVERSGRAQTSALARPDRARTSALSGRPYIRFALIRVAQGVAVLVLVYVVVFVALTVIPGDPISERLQAPGQNHSKAEIARLLAYYGLDRGYPEQLSSSLVHALTGDFGYSLLNGASVTSVLGQALPTTLLLASIALGIAVAIGVVVAVGAAYLPHARGGDLLRALPSLFLSVPNFLIGLLLIQFLSFQLGWFQVVRDEGLKSYLLPAVTLGIAVSAPIAEVLITGLDSARSQQYAVMAVAKGLSSRRIFFAHLLKPAALPTLTIVGLAVGELLGGAVIVESVFGLNGIGSIVERSVINQDTPVLLAIAVLAASFYVVINLIVDLSYPLLDPRLRTPAVDPVERS